MSWLSNVNRWIILTNNYCNLNCEKCSTGSNRTVGSHPFQSMSWTINPQDVAHFLWHLSPRKTEIRLLGGETTAMPWDTLYDIIDLIKTDEHKLSMLTNGFGLQRMARSALTAFDNFVLNAHGTNDLVIRECEDLLRTYEIPFETIRHGYHFDLEEAAAHVLNKGRNCHQWLSLPCLYDKVIYPCCSMMQLKEGKRDTWASLKRSGWHLENPKLMTDILDMSTLEPMIFQRCFNECYMPDIHRGRRYKITPKDRDQLRRPK